MTTYSRLMLILAWLAALLFAAAGAMLSYEVIARYGFTAPTVWAAELSQLCLVWGAMISMPWLLAARRHISVDAAVRLLPETLQRATDVLAMAVVAAVSAVVAWYGGEIAGDSLTRGRTTGSLLDIPAAVGELAIPVGFALLGVQALIEIARTLGGHAPAEGIEGGESGQ